MCAAQDRRYSVMFPLRITAPSAVATATRHQPNTANPPRDR